MGTQETFNRLTEIFRDIFDDDDIVLRPEMTAEDIDEWDSLAHIRLILETEKRFSIQFSATETKGLENVGAFIALIEQKAAS